MKNRTFVWTVCVAIATGMLACGTNEEDTPQVGAFPEQVGNCTILSAGTTWWNQTFPEQRGQFHAEFDATASEANIDAVVGLSDGSATTFSKLATIVRFAPNGVIDVRSGGAYRADFVEQYQPGTTYHFRVDVNVATHTYTVSFRRPGNSQYFKLASNYAFRSEQAGVARLSNVAGKIDSDTGSLNVCGFTVVADGSTASDCVTATAGGGFATLRLSDADVLQTVSLVAKPSVANIDGVIGFSAGPAAAFNDLATAIRFSPTGAIDFRDGDTYHADMPATYQPGMPWSFRMVADVTSHRFSVFEGTDTFSVNERARQFAFRTQQAGATHMDYMNVIVDDPQGSLEVCSVRGIASSGVTYSREGAPWIAALANDQALISDGATTQKVDAKGAVLASVNRGGAVTADVVGNVFIASVTGNTLSVEKLDPSFNTRWRATDTVLAGTTITAMAADPTGAILIGAVTPQDQSISVTKFNAGGAFMSQLWASGSTVAIDSDGAIAWAWNDQNANMLRISKANAEGSPIWQRSFAGQTWVDAMTFDPDHNLIFGGSLGSARNFGGATLAVHCPSENPCVDGYLVKLAAADGAHVFSRELDTNHVDSISANASRIAVSNTFETQFWWTQLFYLDANGNTATGPSWQTGWNGNGHSGRVVLGASGRTWWNTAMAWPVRAESPYMLAFGP